MFVACLKYFNRVVGVIIHVDVFEKNIGYFCAIAVVYVQYCVAASQYITVGKGYVVITPAGGFHSYLTRLAPIAPQYAVVNRDIFIVGKCISVDSLDGDGIVEGMDKGICYADVTAVYNVDPIGIVSPLTKHLDAINGHVEAMEKILEWLKFTTVENRHIIWVRSCGMGWKNISLRCGKCRSSIIRMYNIGLKDIQKALENEESSKNLHFYAELAG